ncbi:IST1-like protein [Sesamum alatum]|uniref:IST1-like protein n=1 Tax=Sesamum alatum TaxID=300844 RepID=A0AAE2CSJ3_9LAMI|nr:IST1-like protein [Sesamum alatum]
MKRSKFLKGSKEMLSRSFNPSKCKMSLRLAASRLKLLRNKKEVQVNQMKREIAKLLESGQDQTARIRVEHVVREEKMMAAYDLIEIYCELIVARLPIIESQKTCPIDLKEAIASIVFASPRCGDVPELLDVRKHFTEKYGKDFTTAAIELRPECGVSRMLVEKLSAKAPDGQTKIKILSAIAEAHNVKWDPTSFEEKESKPPSDLLTGPSTFGKESKAHVEPPRFEGPDAQAPQTNNTIHGSPSNFSQPDHRTSQGAANASAQTSGPRTAFQQEGRPPALVDERAQLFQGDSNAIPLDRQRWNMEFKDATAAAQAAAESAERASMAARAAAELSSRGRIMRQYSTESHKSDGPALKDGGPETYAKPIFSEESMNTSFSEHTSLQNEPMDGLKPHNQKIDGRFKVDGRGGRKEYNQSASLRSKASRDDNSLDHDVPVVQGYSQNNSLEEVPGDEMPRQRQSFKYKAENANGWPGKSENVREERIRKQPSDEFYHPPSSIPDDVNIFSNSDSPKFDYDDVEDPFQGYMKEGTYGEATSSHQSAALVFDNSDSDSEIYGFNSDPTYDEQGPRSYLPSSGQKSPEHLSMKTDSGSPTSSSSNVVKSTSPLFFTRKNSSSDLSESLDGSKLDDSVPVAFDESDGSASESDEDMNVFRNTGMEDSRDFPSKQNPSVRSHVKDKSKQSVGSSFKEKASSGFDQKQWSLSSDDELKSDEFDTERNQGKLFDADPPEKFSFTKPSADQPALEPKKSQMELNYIEDSSPESGEGLNFGKLTGGLRHKGYNRAPYLKKQSDVSSSFNTESKDTTTSVTKSTAPAAVESPRISTRFEHKKNARMSDLRYESDSESSEEEEPLQKSSGHKQGKLYNLRSGKEVKTKPSLAASTSIFGSDSSDMDEDPPKESLTRKSESSGHKQGKLYNVRSGKEVKTKPSLAASNSILGSDSSDMDEDPPKESLTRKSEGSGHKQGKVYNLRSGEEVKTKPTLVASTSIFGSDSSDMDEDPPKESLTRTGYRRSGISRRTKASPSSSNNSYSKVGLRSDAPDSDGGVGRKPMNASSPETRDQSQFSKKSSSQLGSSEQPTSAKVASKPTSSSLQGTSDKHNSGKASPATVQEPKITHKSSATEEPSRPQPKAEISDSNENLKAAATLNKTSSNKDDSNQKASHVHPKLPDYDALVQSLRKNRS